MAFTDETVTSTLTGAIVNGSTTKDTASLTLTNAGNIPSTGKTTVELLLSTDGTVASGTKIRTVSEQIALKPDQSRTVKFALGTLPSVTDGTYEIVAEVTDPKGNVTTAATATTVNPAAAFQSLTPTVSAIPLNGTVTLTIANEGNTASKGVTIIKLYASATSTTTDATLLRTLRVNLRIAPGAARAIRIHLTPHQYIQVGIEKNLVAQVTDYQNSVQTAASQYLF